MLNEFKQGDNIDLDVLSDAVVELCLNGSDRKVFEVADMNLLS